MPVSRFWTPIALMAAIAGCSRSDPAQICRLDNLQDCKTYPSLKDAQQVQQKEFAKARRWAKSLPFDYRDLVHTVLVNYVQRPRLSATLSPTISSASLDSTSMML